MKKLFIITILILNGCVSVKNVELTIKISEGDSGKYQIRSMEDYHKYYIDTVKIEAGEDKLQVIRNATEDGYLNSPEGSDVYVHTKNRLIAFEQTVEKRILLRERFLEDYLEYTYVRKNSRGHRAHRELIAGVISHLSKDLVEVGRKREATELNKLPRSKLTGY